MLDTVIPIELKEVTNEKREEREDHTTKPTDSLEEEGKDGSGYTFTKNPVCNVPGGPGCNNPPPNPPAEACTAAVFRMPGLTDGIVTNKDCDSYAILTSGSV